MIRHIFHYVSETIFYERNLYEFEGIQFWEPDLFADDFAIYSFTNITLYISILVSQEFLRIIDTCINFNTCWF